MPSFAKCLSGEVTVATLRLVSITVEQRMWAYPLVLKRQIKGSSRYGAEEELSKDRRSASTATNSGTKLSLLDGFEGELISGWRAIMGAVVTLPAR